MHLALSPGKKNTVSSVELYVLVFHASSSLKPLLIERRPWCLLAVTIPFIALTTLHSFWMALNLPGIFPENVLFISLNPTVSSLGHEYI